MGKKTYPNGFILRTVDTPEEEAEFYRRTANLVAFTRHPSSAPAPVAEQSATEEETPGEEEPGSPPPS